MMYVTLSFSCLFAWLVDVCELCEFRESASRVWQYASERTTDAKLFAITFAARDDISEKETKRRRRSRNSIAEQLYKKKRKLTSDQRWIGHEFSDSFYRNFSFKFRSIFFWFVKSLVNRRKELARGTYEGGVKIGEKGVSVRHDIIATSEKNVRRISRELCVVCVKVLCFAHWKWSNSSTHCLHPKPKCKRKIDKDEFGCASFVVRTIGMGFFIEVSCL